MTGYFILQSIMSRRGIRPQVTIHQCDGAGHHQVGIDSVVHGLCQEVNCFIASNSFTAAADVI